MASQIPRQASSLLSLSARPRLLRFALPNRQILRCAHEEAAPTEEYVRQSTQLPYTYKGFNIGRPQQHAPFGVRKRTPFICNDDPAVLDAMYLKLLGKDMIGLSEESKWQAVTHKSFDHGRQPFNTKLRFLGKRMLQMQASFHLLAIPRIEKFAPATPSVYKSLEEEEYLNPEPFVHKDYRSLDNVNRTNIDAAISDLKLLPIIENCGLAGVMRWKPAVVEDLVRSGQSTVAVETLHAIIGMLTLQKGGDVASRFCREKILSPGSRAKKAVEVRKAAEKEVAEKKAAAAQEKSGDGVLKE